MTVNYLQANGRKAEKNVALDLTCLDGGGTNPCRLYQKESRIESFELPQLVMTEPAISSHLELDALLKAFECLLMDGRG